MTKKRFIELVNDYEYKWTTEEIDEACALMIKDAAGKIDLFKYTGLVMYAFERTLNEYSDKLNYCFQHYIKCLNNAPEELKRVGYPYVLFVELNYLYNHGFMSEALFCVDELLGYEFYYPAYDYLACCFAINMFLRSNLYDAAKEYVEIAEDMINRTKEIYARLPLTDQQSIFVAEALIRYFIATDKKQKIAKYVNVLKKIRKSASDDERRIIDKDLLLAEVCLNPSSGEIISKFWEFMEQFKTEEGEIIQNDLDFLPVFRKIKDYTSEEKLVKYSKKLIETDNCMTVMLSIYNYLIDELGISEKKYPEIYKNYVQVLKASCVDFSRSSANSLTNYLTRKKLDKDFRDKALVDSLTGFGTRLAFEQKRIAHNAQTDSKLIVFMLDVNALKYVNDNYGHSEGNVLLSEASKIMRDAFGENGKVYRAGGDEFIAIEFAGFIDPKDVVKKIHEGSKNFKGVHPYPVAISVGYAEHLKNPELGFDDLVKLADAKMYEDKEKFYTKYPKYRRK